ncbi:MAG TPA: hypothetical protein DDY98_07895 [Ruminococcaceae bacterium]|nr:hypothetical protein [Oscillospiraceae bacterium]
MAGASPEQDAKQQTQTSVVINNASVFFMVNSSSAIYLFDFSMKHGSFQSFFQNENGFLFPKGTA